MTDDSLVHGRKRPQWNADELRVRLRQYDRTPFLDLLQHWLDQSPAVEDIEKLSKRSPDKFISALSALAKIAGYTEKTESNVNVNINVAKMSDSQIEDELRRRSAELGLVIDVDAITSEASTGHASTGHGSASTGNQAQRSAMPVELTRRRD